MVRSGTTFTLTKKTLQIVTAQQAAPTRKMVLATSPVTPNILAMIEARV
jgi:hypothetical protein